jgi:hypothetical protein
MTPTEKGRHCAACNKVVTDFSTWSDGAISAFLSKPQNAGACGRYRTSQLNRPLYLPEQPHSLLYRWVLAAGIAAIMLTVPLQSRAQQDPPYPRRLQMTEEQLEFLRSTSPDYMIDELRRARSRDTIGAEEISRCIKYRDPNELTIGGGRSEGVLIIIEGTKPATPDLPLPLPQTPQMKTYSGEELDRMRLGNLNELPR